MLYQGDEDYAYSTGLCGSGMIEVVLPALMGYRRCYNSRVKSL